MCAMGRRASFSPCQSNLRSRRAKCPGPSSFEPEPSSSSFSAYPSYPAAESAGASTSPLASPRPAPPRPAQLTAQSARIAEGLRENHNCNHDQWRWVSGAHECEECLHGFRHATSLSYGLSVLFFSFPFMPRGRNPDLGALLFYDGGLPKHI